MVQYCHHVDTSEIEKYFVLVLLMLKWNNVSNVWNYIALCRAFVLLAHLFVLSIRNLVISKIMTLKYK